MRICGIYYITPAFAERPLPILASRLRTEVVDLTANHTLTQTFYNPHPPKSTNETPTHIKDAKYSFPLYESCAVRSFSAEIGSKFINGVVKPREEAKAVYDAAKAAGKRAALLEQNTGEAFTTSIGNIRPGEFVTVVIKYVHELKQDIEGEGVRLVVPTIISLKYGNVDFANFGMGWDNGWNNMSTKLEKIAEGKLKTKGLAIEVTATMNGSIRGVQSPSHPIAINIGSHDASGQGEFNPQMARAVLAIPTASTTGLEKDFTLIINSTDISMPRAFLAPHPTIPSKSTLLVTLVPRFELPQQRPEVVFVVDRSGSMTDKIATVRSALHLFLASLPVGVHFNIISFGSRHSSLWPKSRLYSAESFEAAKRHIDSIDANMGGTEMLAPCQQAVTNRAKGLNLEVLVLTDGDIWQTEALFDFINESTSAGDARFFSLGIGESVSHLLVEGIGRAGKGYSQIVGEGENMQKKIMRMLKSALTPHVNDWSIDWDGKPAIMSSFSQKKTAEPTVHATISLYDTSSNPDEAKSTPSPLPARPPILQTPATIPSLYSFTRTSVYILLTDCTAPKSVRLLGTAHDPSTNSIHPLALTIPVTTVTSPSSALGLYSLLGRKLLQDLEEGRCGYLPANSPHKDAEGRDLGVMFGLASKWTSFVAVTTGDGGEEMDVTADVLTPQASDDDEPKSAPGIFLHRYAGSISAGSPVMARHAKLPVMRHKKMARISRSSAPLESVSGQPQQQQQQQRVPPNQFSDGSLNRMCSNYEDEDEGDERSHNLYHNPGVGHRAGQASESSIPDQITQQVFSKSYNASMPIKTIGNAYGSAPPLMTTSTATDTTPSDLISQLSRLQLFSGHFELSQALLDVIGVSEDAIKSVGDWTKNGKETAWVSVIVVVWLRKVLATHSEEWEMMASKAWDCALSEVGAEIAKMEIDAEGIVGGAAS